MVKVIATADCHIKMVPGVSKRWQIARYERFISDLVDKCVKSNSILVIAGDLLDSVSAKKEELQLVLKLLHSLYAHNVTTLMVSGNHSTIKTGESFLDYLELNRFPNIVYRNNFEIENVKFHLVNHDSIHGYVPDLGNGLNILISHFRCNFNKFVTEEIDVEKFTGPFDFCIAGDIHAPFEIGNVVYTDKPINKEFDSNPSCGYLEITIDKDVTYKRVPTYYPSLVGKKVKAHEFNNLVFQPEHYYRVEVEGSPAELKSIQPPSNNVILSKVPVVQSAIASVEEVEKITEDAYSDDGLIGYMKSLNYEDDLIANMMSELRRDV